jgi:uncharacterized protein
MSTALITGSSSGIGRVLVDLFAKDGYDVILVARRDQHQVKAEVEKHFGVKAHVLSLDLSKPGAGVRLFDEVQRLGLQVDALVNNAGFSKYGKFHELPIEQELDIIHTNITSVVEGTRLFMTGMIGRGRGHILNVASTAAFQPGPRMAVYYAAKAFVLSFSEAIAHELEDTGVKVSVLCPGPTRTEFIAVANYKETGFASLAMASADQVARAGYQGLMRGERVIVPGVINKMTALSAQLGPRGLVLRTTAALTKSRE